MGFSISSRSSISTVKLAAWVYWSPMGLQRGREVLCFSLFAPCFDKKWETMQRAHILARVCAPYWAAAQWASALSSENRLDQCPHLPPRTPQPLVGSCLQTKQSHFGGMLSSDLCCLCAHAYARVGVKSNADTRWHTWMLLATDVEGCVRIIAQYVRGILLQNIARKKIHSQEYYA